MRPRFRTTAAALILTAAAMTATGTTTSAQAASTAQVTGAAQTIAGFGASGAWWPDDLVNFSSSVQQQVANLLFTSSGIELSQYRYNIGGGGVGVTTPARAPQSFLTSSGSYDWSNDPGGQIFLKDAAADGVPDIIGFVNSAPEQYTTNNENCGGSINTSDEAAYGTYLATIVSHFASEGVKISQVSPMNEPDDTFSSCGQEGMGVPATERAGVISAIGAALKNAGESTTIIADESSQTTQLTSEAPDWLSNSTAASYVSAVAHHTYNYPSGTTLEQVETLGADYGKATWASEICCQITGGGYGAQYDPTISGGLVLANYIYNDFSYGNDSAFQWWTALSSAMGCDPATSSSCATLVNSSGWNDGLIYYDPDYASDGNQSIYISKRFYVLGQYSRFVRPGSVRYTITGAPSGVQAMAFYHNGAWDVVATNTNSSPVSFSLNTDSGTLTSEGAYQTSASENIASVSAPSISGSVMSATLPADSVTTYVLGSSGAPGSGGYTASELVGTGSGLCLTATSSGGTIQSCSAAGDQEFERTAAGTIVLSSGGCLDVAGESTSTGAETEEASCDGASSQQWVIHPDGSITNEHSGLCLDVTGAATSAGTKVEQWTCNGGTNQQWQIG